MTQHVFLYSHGFGVEKTDRGLFTDIQNAFPDIVHVLFDYNHLSPDKQTLTVAAFSEQTVTLHANLHNVHTKYPNADIHLIAHSQGCIIAGLVAPSTVRNVIFLAPPTSVNAQRSAERFGQRPGAVIDLNGISHLPRNDGTTTLVPAKFWTDLEKTNILDAYRQLARNAPLSVIAGEYDEILTTQDLSVFEDFASVLSLPDNHNFTQNRQALLTCIENIVFSSTSNSATLEPSLFIPSL